MQMDTYVWLWLQCQDSWHYCALHECHVLQITYHSLQCIFQHLHFTKGNSGANGAGPSSTAKPVGLAAILFCTIEDHAHGAGSALAISR